MRISFEDMAIKIAEAVSLRSEDQHKKVGCTILDQEGRLLSIGYNGVKPKQKIHKSFWLDRDERRKYVLHAEANALSCISRCDNPYLLATTLLPCSACAVNIATYNIKKVLYLEDYEKDQKSLDIFKFYNIKLIKYKNV
jgi:dCMP deaminase